MKNLMSMINQNMKMFWYVFWVKSREPKNMLVLLLFLIKHATLTKIENWVSVQKYPSKRKFVETQNQKLDICSPIKMQKFSKFMVNLNYCEN
jgi:hypothetical protein